MKHTSMKKRLIRIYYFDQPSDEILSIPICTKSQRQIHRDKLKTENFLSNLLGQTELAIKPPKFLEFPKIETEEAYYNTNSNYKSVQTETDITFGTKDLETSSIQFLLNRYHPE